MKFEVSQNLLYKPTPTRLYLLNLRYWQTQQSPIPSAQPSREIAWIIPAPLITIFLSHQPSPVLYLGLFVLKPVGYGDGESREGGIESLEREVMDEGEGLERGVGELNNYFIRYISQVSF